jgi:diadenosine tetraphosphate (Ap4A) HIT family hydrolase
MSGTLKGHTMAVTATTTAQCTVAETADLLDLQDRATMIEEDLHHLMLPGSLHSGVRKGALLHPQMVMVYHHHLRTYHVDPM